MNAKDKILAAGFTRAQKTTRISASFLTMSEGGF
jgi:hypothetical protein